MNDLRLIAEKTIAFINTNRKVKIALVAALALVIGYEAFTLGTHFGEFAYHLVH